MERNILLSFDVEEFDLPAEYGVQIPVEKQLTVSYEGLKKIEALLKDTKVVATLYTTAFFAENFRAAMQSLAAHHEIASHTYYHGKFHTADLLSSRQCIENITGKKINGLRMPRMQAVDSTLVTQAGYTYNSSINPTWVPGRYNNLTAKRTLSSAKGLTTLPLSVSPFLRLPLFWLAFKNLPYSVFLKAVIRTLKHDGYLHLYFHPWEFTNLAEYRIPAYIKKLNGDELLNRLQQLLNDLANEGIFTGTSGFIENYKSL